MDYVLLGTATLIIALLTFLLWKQTNYFGFVVGIGILYYFTLAGSWYVLLGEDLELADAPYRALFVELFAVRIDEHYYDALAIYSFFLVVILVVLLMLTGKRSCKEQRETSSQLLISHGRVILVSWATLLASIALIWTRIGEAVAYNESLYLATRLYDLPWYFSIHRLLLWVSASVSFMGVAVLLSSKGSRYITGSRQTLWYIMYLVLLAAIFFCNAILGNKAPLLYGLMCGFLLFTANHKRPRLGIAILVAILCIGPIAIISKIRANRSADLETAWTETSMVDAPQTLASSAEMFAAHFSLYGAISEDVPLQYGSSIISLVASFVPKAIWPDRPDDIYVTYAEYTMGGVGPRGFTIHHATGWYLNFGIPGVMLGAILLAALWAKLYNGMIRSPSLKVWEKVLFLIGLQSFTAYLPSICRAGPEVYKGICFEALLIPAVAFFFSLRRNPARRTPNMDIY
jgi:oligosaccharide repeat unit polymerase